MQHLPVLCPRDAGAGCARAGNPVPPAPERWVTDGAGLLSSEARQRLDTRLEAYERQTGHQVVIWIGTTLGSTPLEDFAVNTFKAWKLGRKGVDDGVLVAVLAQDRRIAIEVGYGLEGQVCDGRAWRWRQSKAWFRWRWWQIRRRWGERLVVKQCFG